ncbi:hypothetical protein ACQPZX_36005 [Actinoplanes sp. CA-142083]|uniref:hypothetical protein n=1 Tax=Actinoplanes sp. CA-142083 TaxID=3239903 RepID=UPI003D8A45BD
MLHALVLAACLSAAFTGSPPADAAEPLGFQLDSATVHGAGLGLQYTTTCPPGLTGAYGLSVTVAQRTGAHVATAATTLREPCAGRSRHVVLPTDPGAVSFRPGMAYARVWGCVGSGCSAQQIPIRVT